MTGREVRDTLSVCDDCVLWIANRDDSALDLYDDADERRRLRDEGLARVRGELVVGDAEDPFRDSRCDICNALPGRRHDVVELGETP